MDRLKVKLSFGWLITLIVTIILLSTFSLFHFAWIPLIVLYQGGHEIQHSTFFKGRDSKINGVIGSICYALFLHNYEYVHKSHGMHHAFGRMDLPHAMVDHPKGLFGTFFYYLNLMGVNYFSYIFAAPLWLVSRRGAALIFGSYKIRLLWISIGILLTVLWGWLTFKNNDFTSVLGTYFIFSIYWGAIQNSAHYGLEFGKGDEYKYVARTYRVPRIIHFMFFGTPFSHFEHHVLPETPGVLLNEERVINEAIAESGITPCEDYGFLSYLSHLLVSQWVTPYPDPVGKWKV